MFLFFNLHTVSVRHMHDVKGVTSIKTFWKWMHDTVPPIFSNKASEVSTCIVSNKHIFILF